MTAKPVSGLRAVRQVTSPSVSTVKAHFAPQDDPSGLTSASSDVSGADCAAGQLMSLSGVRQDGRLVALIQEIRQFPEKRHCVEDLARRVGMSESVLTVAFKKLTGFSPYAFVANCRLQRAREEIETTRDSFATIAMRLGYASAQHLARQFKSAFGQTMSGCRAGLTPSQRRQREN